MKNQFEESKFDSLLEQFINPEDLTDFLKQLQKRGIEKMLEGELSHHLGYQKQRAGNSRNGSFTPVLVPKRKNVVDGIENVMISLLRKRDELTAFLEFPLEIRKIIYTTNLIENLNGKI